MNGIAKRLAKRHELVPPLLSKSLKVNGGEYENRTHVHGFAIRCVTTPPTRRQGAGKPYPILPDAARLQWRENLRLLRCRRAWDVAHL